MKTDAHDRIALICIVLNKYLSVSNISLQKRFEFYIRDKSDNL